MKESVKIIVFVGILIILLITLKSAQGTDINVQLEQESKETILLLDTNRIAIITTNKNSGNYGDILILEYDAQKKDVSLAGRFNYSNYIRNPNKYINKN